MTNDDPNPAWLYEGGPVVVSQGFSGSKRDRMRHSTVARITKRDVILVDGERFNRGRLRKSSGSAWAPDQVLNDPGDSKIVQWLAEQRADGIRATCIVRVEPLLRAWRQASDDTAGVEALGALKSALDELSALAVPATQRKHQP